VLNQVVSYLDPLEVCVRLVCSELNRRWQGEVAAWLSGQLHSRTGTWLADEFGRVFPQLYRTSGLRAQAEQFGTFLGIWREEVERRILVPLQRGVSLSLLWTLPSEVPRSASQEATLGQFRRCLRQLPWRLLWERVWLLYRWLPSAWRTLAHPLSLYGSESGNVIPDPRVFAFPEFRPDQRFNVYHLWSRLLLTVFPLGLRPRDWRPPEFMRNGVSILLTKIRSHGVQTLDPALRQLAVRLMHHPFQEVKFYGREGSVKHTLLVASLDEMRMLEMHTMGRRTGRQCLVGVITLCQGQYRLLPVQAKYLDHFRLLGERWEEEVVESGRCSGRCVWCGRKSGAARRTGVGPRCAVLYGEESSQ